MTPHSLAQECHTAGPGARRGDDPPLALIAAGQDLWKQDQQRAGEAKFLAALDALVRQYQAEIIGFCVEVLQGTGVQGEDIAQEVFLAAYKAMPHFEARASLRTWLYRIARNQCAHVVRDEARHLQSLATHRAPVLHRAHRAAELPPEQRLQDHEVRTRVQASLTQLKEADRTVLVLTYMRELTTDQIAEILMITPQQVRTRRSRALKRLRMVVDHEAR